MNRRTIKTFLINYQYIDSGSNLSNLLQRNSVCGFAFLGVDEVGVDLGGFDALVGEHLGDRIDVRAECNLERGKGVSEAVKCDMLSNPRSLYPGV